MEPALKLTLKSVVRTLDAVRANLTAASSATDSDRRHEYIFAADQNTKIAAERVENVIAFFEKQIAELEEEMRYVDSLEVGKQ